MLNGACENFRLLFQYPACAKGPFISEEVISLSDIEKFQEFQLSK